MKILLTGFTTRMGGQPAKNEEKNYLSTSFVLAEILSKHLHHEVDHRKVLPGEDFNKYDLAILGICPIGSAADQTAYISGTAWAFANVRCPKLLFCEDWRIQEAGTQFKSALRNWSRYAKFKGYKPKEENCVQHTLLQVLEAPHPLLTSFFPWGKHDRLFANNLPKANVLQWDPSPFCTFPEPVKVTERAKRWVNAALHDHSSWINKQHIDWPVDSFGKGNRISEEKLVRDEYPKRWGILAPRYKTAGCGWWRVRFNHAAHVGSVMLCDRDDSQVMGRPYQIKSSVELRDDDELQNLAQDQREWFNANIATRDQTLSNVKAALEVAASRTEMLV